MKKTESGHETRVTFYGDYVVKEPIATQPKEMVRWLGKQQVAAKASEALNKIKNPAYNVPKVLEIDVDKFKVIEAIALGKTLQKISISKLGEPQKLKIIKSIAEMCNDMNQEKHIEYEITSYKLDEVYYTITFDSIIENSKPFISDKAFYNAIAANEYLLQSPNYKTALAYGNPDLNPGNILFDKDSETVSFIDFAESAHSDVHLTLFSPMVYILECQDIIESIYKGLPKKNKNIILNNNFDHELNMISRRLLAFYVNGVLFLKNTDEESKQRNLTLMEHHSKKLSQIRLSKHHINWQQ